MPKQGLAPGTAGGLVNAEGAADYLFGRFFLGSTRVGWGVCKAGRAWGNLADVPLSPTPRVQGPAICRIMIELARFRLGSGPYDGGIL